MSGSGGGIYCVTPISILSSTLSGNSAGVGGAILCGNSAHLFSSTVSGNLSDYGGGGIFYGTSLFLQNSIVTNNIAPMAPDLLGGNTEAIITTAGHNLISSLDGQTSLSLATPGLTVADSLLAPLANYGGPTQTMPPLLGSPALDAATTSLFTSDQRGFLITDGSPDIGAVEYQGVDDIALFPLLWDTDSDDDGIPFGLELATGGDPLSALPTDSLKLPTFVVSPTEALITFGRNTTAPDGTHWYLERSEDLSTFDTIFHFDGTTTITLETGNTADLSTIDEFNITDIASPQLGAFYRLGVEYQSPN